MSNLTPIGRAHAFVTTLEDKADIDSPYPAWHGWALRDAWMAGYHAGMKDESDISDSVNRQITELKQRVAELEDALIVMTTESTEQTNVIDKVRARKRGRK